MSQRLQLFDIRFQPHVLCTEISPDFLNLNETPQACCAREEDLAQKAGVLSVAPLPGAESYCKGYQNKGLFPAMLLLSRLGRRCNKTQTLQRFLGTAQD